MKNIVLTNLNRHHFEGIQSLIFFPKTKNTQLLREISITFLCEPVRKTCGRSGEVISGYFTYTKKLF